MSDNRKGNQMSFEADVATYCCWFREQHSRDPVSLRELAQFLDNERSHGQFPDNRAVRAMYELADDPAANRWFVNRRTAAAIDDLQVTYRGQLYRRIAVEPYTRADGSVRQLATWESRCPVCGDLFTIQTTRLHRLREPNRRCAQHRRPGSPVRWADASNGGA
jgi:hypothetical protein